MRAFKPICALLILLGAIAGSAAHAGGVRFGVNIGFPLFFPGWYYPPPPYYYPPPVVAMPSSPPVYIERSDAQAAPTSEAYWYYCADSQTYYPYVKECPSPWQRVSPRPSTQ
jgi:hypothetical protein